jgi:phosphoglycerate kinase
MFTADNIKGKNVLVRLDLDVPIQAGVVENNYRLRAVIPTIKLCLQYARRTCLVGHLGRPSGVDQQFSLVPVKNELERLTNQSISFISSGFSTGECWKGENPISLLENIRFNQGEEKLDRGFAQVLSQGADLYIYEACASYRPCASLSLIPELLPTTLA